MFVDSSETVHFKHTHEVPNDRAAFQKFEEEEGERKIAESSMKKKDSTFVSHSQMTIKQGLKSNLYPKYYKKQLAITRKLGVFVGATSMTFLVEKKVAKEIDRVKAYYLTCLAKCKRDKFLL